MKISKFMRVAALSLALALTVPSVLPAAVPAATVEAAAKKLNKTKLVLPKKGTYKLTVNTSKKVTWKSSNAKVATVSKKGNVTAKKAGTAKITATFGKKKLTCKVTVVNARLNKTTATIDKGSTNSAESSLELRVIGLTEAEQADVRWSCSDTDVVALGGGWPNSACQVSGMKEGTATVYAKYHGATMSCKVTVVDNGYTVNPTVYPQGVVKFNDADDLDEKGAPIPKNLLDDVTITSASINFVKFEKAYRTQTGDLARYNYTYHVTITGTVDPKQKDKLVEVYLGGYNFAYVPDAAVREKAAKELYYGEPEVYKGYYEDTSRLITTCDANGNFVFDKEVKSSRLPSEVVITDACVVNPVWE